jgi:hypothetical protein
MGIVGTSGNRSVLMTTMAQTESLFGDRIQRMERRLEAAKQLRQIAIEFPDLFTEFAAEAVPGAPGNARQVAIDHAIRQPHTGASNFARIKQFFVDQKNDWFQAPQIGAALGLTRGTVATVLWTSHEDQFEKMPVPNSKKKKLWRLKQDVYADAVTDPDLRFGPVPLLMPRAKEVK